jgi:hypothetical protein
MSEDNVSSLPIEVDQPFKVEKGCKKRLKDSDCVLVKRWQTDFRFPTGGNFHGLNRCGNDQNVNVPKMNLYPNVSFEIGLEIKNVFYEGEQIGFGEKVVSKYSRKFYFYFKKNETATADIPMLFSICILDIEEKKNKVLVELHDMKHSLEKSRSVFEDNNVQYTKRPRDYLRLQVVVKIPSYASGTLDMSKGFGQDNLTEFKIVSSDGTIFKCHKIILVGKSEFFSTLFEMNAKTASLNADVKATTMKTMLKFIYQGLVNYIEATADLLIAAN